MRLAYADPPYPGRAHLYADHPDYAGEVAYHELVEILDCYDGWALSTSAESLRWMLPLCRREHRLIVWVKHTVAVSWEPVIVASARPPEATLRDWIQVEPDAYQWRDKPDGYVIGQKPAAFCMRCRARRHARRPLPRQRQRLGRVGSVAGVAVAACGALGRRRGPRGSARSGSSAC